jgi:Spy/CpxP family protein refolding chaperone
MRTFLPLIAATLLALTPMSPAQAAETTGRELTRQIVETEHQAIVAAAMALTEEQAQAFWPIYKAYQQEMRAVADQYLSLIQRYASAYPQGIDDATSAQLMNDWLAMEEDGTKIRRRYLKKFAKALPPALVLRFFQIENKLTTIIRAEVALQIPLTGP